MEESCFSVIVVTLPGGGVVSNSACRERAHQSEAKQKTGPRAGLRIVRFYVLQR